MIDAWNAGNGAAFAAPFSDTADFIAFEGTHLKGRWALVLLSAEWYSARTTRSPPPASPATADGGLSVPFRQELKGDGV